METGTGVERYRGDSAEMPSALARMEDERRGGIAALARMTEDEFNHNLAMLKRGQERVRKIHIELMEPDIDYGKIPGTGDKPTLLQPGAEKLCTFYRLIPTFEIDTEHGDGVTGPHIDVTVVCHLHQGAEDGPVVGAGVGNCNTWERKYRYRRGERSCPSCGVMGALLKSKQEPEWFCWAKRGGCGTSFPLDDPEIVGQVVGNVDNEDPFDLKNTILKMAKKRALIDATKSTTGTSSLYTQDLEDLTQADAGNPPPGTGKQTGKAQAPRQNRASAPAQAPSGGKCPKCNAPAGKPHTRQCPDYTNGNGGQTQAQAPAAAPEPDEQLQPTPPGNTPKQEQDDARGRMFAAYERAGGDKNDQGAMLRHCELLLAECLGEQHSFTSRTQINADQAAICTEYFDRRGLPSEPVSDAQQELLPDPFDGE